MSEDELPKPDYFDAREQGVIEDTDGYHQPGGNAHQPDCGCELVTPKGAYRYETVTLDGVTIRYLHQHPVVVTDGDRYRLDSCGWKTDTTKRTINEMLPYGFKVYQREGDWYVERPDDDPLPFEDGMVVDTEREE
jgi:hypothetical protein